jgi:hypothetical protein
MPEAFDLSLLIEEALDTLLIADLLSSICLELFC